MEFNNIKSKFPIFKQKINGKPLVYLDSANSSQKPKVVIDKISSFYETEYSNVGRSVHTLAVKATNRFEATRDKIQKYLNAKHREEIIFTKGATEAINLVASSYGKKYKDSFDIIYPDLAKKFNLLFIPFLLQDVALNPELNLSDGIHPNEKGVKIISNTILKKLITVLKN